MGAPLESLSPIDHLYVDIDGVLTPLWFRSWLALTAMIALKIGNCTIKQAADFVRVHKKIYKKFLDNEIDKTETVIQIMDLWRQCAGENSITKNKINEIVKWLVENKITPTAIRAIKEIQEIVPSIGVTLISASFDLFVEKVGEELDLEAISGSQLIFDENGILVSFEFNQDQARQKIDTIKKREENIERILVVDDDFIAIAEELQLAWVVGNISQKELIDKLIKAARAGVFLITPSLKILAELLILSKKLDPEDIELV